MKFQQLLKKFSERLDIMDILEFRIMTAGTSGEHWADSDRLRQIPVVKIFINHKDFREIVKPIELPFTLLEEDPDTAEEWAGEYGCIPAEELYHELLRYPEEVSLFTCPACGESGCWSVVCTVTETENSVIWNAFRHNHRDWNYPLTYQFSKQNYFTELEKIAKAYQKI